MGDKGGATPDDSNPREQRDIIVSNVNEDLIKNEIYDRTIKVGFSGAEEKIVHIVHFTTWPDFGVPNLSTFSEVVYLVNNLNTTKSKIYVHCSAGVGRTGTFCLVDSILKDYQNGVDIDSEKIMERAVSLKVCLVFQQLILTLKLQKQRFGMIQTQEQYHFAYSSIAHIIEQNVNK